MNSKKCILTSETLTPDNDSKAHVIPSALGGNLKPKGILSKEANGILNDKFDSPLIKSLHPFMALLGGIPDRGEVQPTQMRAENGVGYSVKFGENLIPTKPTFNSEEVDGGGKRYEITARTVKEAITLLGKVKKENPDVIIDEGEIAKKFVFREEPVEGHLHKQLNLGPNVFFPAAFVMASIFSVAHGFESHPNFVDFVYSFDGDSLKIDTNVETSKPTLPPNTFYWATDEKWFSVDAEISHVLVLLPDPLRQTSIFYVELFNMPGVAVLLPYSGSDERLVSHGINVVTGETIAVDVDQHKLKSLDWKTTHPWVAGELNSFFKLAQERVGNIVRFSQERAHRHEIDQKIYESFGDLNDKVLTEEERKGVFEVISSSYIKRILRRWR